MRCAGYFRRCTSNHRIISVVKSGIGLRLDHVPRAGDANQLHGDVRAAQGRLHLLRVLDRHELVLVSVNEQDRRVVRADAGDRRGLQIHLELGALRVGQPQAAHERGDGGHAEVIERTG